MGPVAATATVSVPPRGVLRWRAGWALLLAAPCAWAQVDAEAPRAASFNEPLRLASTPDTARLPRIDLNLIAPAPSPSRAVEPAALVQQTLAPRPEQSLNLALRWRPDGRLGGMPIQASVWRQVTSNQLDAENTGSSYGAQVEMELTRDPKAALRDLLGMKLDNGAKISLRRRNGQFAVYYRVQF